MPLLQGKQLADVMSHGETRAGAVQSGTAARAARFSLPPPKSSRAPWMVAVAGLLVVGAVVGGLYFRQEHQREVAAAEQRAIRSGTIEVHSVPEGAAVWLNDAPTAYHTPYTLSNLETGANARFTVRLTAAGYEPYVAQVPLPQRYAHATVQAQLEHARAQSYAVLEVTTTPRGATVLIDGREMPGTTPLTVPQITPGVEHTVLVRHPDAQDEVFTFVAQAGAIERRPLALHERPLAADEAWLSVAADPSSVVLRVGDRELRSGPFHVRIHSGDSRAGRVQRAPGYETETRVARARAGETLTPAERASIADNVPGGGSGEANVDRRPGSQLQWRLHASGATAVTVDVERSRANAGRHLVDLAGRPHGGLQQPEPRFANSARYGRTGFARDCSFSAPIDSTVVHGSRTHAAMDLAGRCFRVPGGKRGACVWITGSTSTLLTAQNSPSSP